MAKGLTPKQQIFVKEYLVDKNATRAAKAAGYSQKTAKQMGTENLAKPAVWSEIEKGLALVIKKVEAQAVRAHKTRDEWLARVEDIAFSDLTEMFATDKDGKLKMSLSDIKGRKIGHLLKKMKVHPNDQHALELLAKHNHWITEQVDLKVHKEELTEEDFNQVFNDPETQALILKIASARKNNFIKGEDHEN